MPVPFMLITTHRINPGAHEEFTALAREYENLLRDKEPELIGYAAYLDPERDEVSLVHVLRDADAAERHMKLAGETIGRGLALVRTVRVEVFGDPGPVLGQAQRANADGGADTSVKPMVLGGFIRH